MCVRVCVCACVRACVRDRARVHVLYSVHVMCRHLIVGLRLGMLLLVCETPPFINPFRPWSRTLRKHSASH